MDAHLPPCTVRDALLAISWSQRGLHEPGQGDASLGVPMPDRDQHNSGLKIEFVILLGLHIIAAGLALAWIVT
ncbi:hypothetical protein A3726_00425 [Erythrobacter sp. HI0037]|nr:hypothetical protein A3719_02615 [Erythrobacter sp. HI0020]KZY16663.1 hypothetical protein A3727_00630 [Erythrobacter sp. HI0038]KZY19751.1 hypothetical protein A3726_33335 [Erythrobacter sp. HI0037]KZY29008.1 hypothetical protein A3726_00425 [Erythrobacter sp. HI0037]